MLLVLSKPTPSKTKNKVAGRINKQSYINPGSDQQNSGIDVGRNGNSELFLTAA